MSSDPRSLHVESSSTSSPNDEAAVADRMTNSFPEVIRRSPHVCTDKVSSSGQDDRKYLISKNVSVAKTSCEDYTPTLSLLSRLKQQSTLLVDVEGIRENSVSAQHVEPTLSSSRRFPYPDSMSEAVSQAKFSQETASAQNRNKHLGDSDLSLSLGMCREQGFKTSGFGSPFFVSDRTGSLPFESVNTVAQQRHTLNPPSDDDSKAASQRLKATESLTAQLTIFYAGAVHIYNDVPKDKAKAIMLLAQSANSGSSHNIHQPLETRFASQSHIPNPSQSLLQHCSSSSVLDTVPQNVHDTGRPISSVGKTLSGLQPAGNVSYTALPQARRISLQRFLQKRTERSRDISPYVNDKNFENGITFPRSRPSSPSFSGSRAASPAALSTGSPSRPSSCGDYTRNGGRSSPALTPLTVTNSSVEVSITSP